jgi:tetratricopeptide (TPR) repeat protein
MQKKNIIIFSILMLSLALVGFDCGSTEITSAKLYIQQKEYAKAKAALMEEIQKNPKSDEGYYLLGDVYGQESKYDSMMGAFSKSLSISNKFEKEIVTQKQYYWANLFNKAVNQYNNAAKVKGDSAKIYLNKSAEIFKQAAIVAPDSVGSYKNMAFVYMNLNEYDSAIAPLQKMIDLSSPKDSSSIDAYKMLGQIWDHKAADLMSKYKSSKDPQDSIQAMQTYNKAINVLQKGRKLYPNDTDLLLYLSNAYIGSDQLDLARNIFQEGIQKDPNNKYYHYDYGVILLDANQFPDAAEQFKKAIDIDSNYESANYNLGVTYVKWGTAMNAAEMAKDSNSTSTAYKEKYRQALPYLEKIVQLKSDDASAWELLGKVYAVLGMKDDAMNAFNKADAIRKNGGIK